MTRTTSVAKLVVVEMVGTGGGTCNVCVTVAVLTIVDMTVDVDGEEELEGGIGADEAEELDADTEIEDEAAVDEPA